MRHILYVETHYEGAHRDWIDSYSARSRHHFTRFTLRGGDWRWRLHGGALTLGRQFLAQRETLPPFDLLLVNGMASASLFLAATRPHLDSLPLALYIQENQLAYPSDEPFRWQDGAIVQVTSAAVADRVFFNGDYLRQDFLRALADFCAQQDETEGWLDSIAPKCAVLRRGIDLSGRFGLPPRRPVPQGPLTFLWSHRWAYEKGVEDFAAALRQLHAEGLPFRVILAGNPWHNLDLREALRAELGEHVLAYGELRGEAYAQALRQADVMVACSLNEPLGVSMLEAIYMGCLPVLPRRGSFPVLLPPEHHDLLYDGSREALIARLRQLITQPETAYRPTLSAIAAAYDWAGLVGGYDDTLEALMDAGPSARL